MELAALLREYVQEIEDVLQERGKTADAGELLRNLLESVLLEKRFPSELFNCSECGYITESRRDVYRHIIEGHNLGLSFYKHSEFSGEPPTFEIDESSGEYICNLCGERTIDRNIRRNWASRHGVPCRNRFKLALTYQCILQDESGEPCQGEAATLEVFLDHLAASHPESHLFTRLTDRDEILKRLEEEPKRSEIGEFLLRFHKEAEKMVEEYLPYYEALLASNTACVKTPDGWALASWEPEEVVKVPSAVSPEEIVERKRIEEEKEKTRIAADEKKKARKPRPKPKPKAKTAEAPEGEEEEDFEEEESMEIDTEHIAAQGRTGRNALPNILKPKDPFGTASNRVIPPMPPEAKQPANYGLYESALLCLLFERGTVSLEEATEELGRYYTVPADHHRVIGSGNTFWEDSIRDGFKHLVHLGFIEAVADRWVPTDEGRSFYDTYLAMATPVEVNALEEMDSTGEYSPEELAFAEEGPRLGYSEGQDTGVDTEEKSVEPEPEPEAQPSTSEAEPEPDSSADVNSDEEGEKEDAPESEEPGLQEPDVTRPE
ncbi:MAG: hypothetical protein ACYS8W_11290 [Planctomycetota bacterium]|jgi:hypothetical protein